MKRAVQWWPKFNLIAPEKSDFIFGASYGIVSIQAYHDLEMMKMAKGIIQDPMTKKDWCSCKNLSSDELVIIATTAKRVIKVCWVVKFYAEASKISEIFAYFVNRKNGEPSKIGHIFTK